MAELDIRSGGDALSLSEVHSYSAAWAQIVAPITYILLTMLGAIILIPFWLIVYFKGDKGQLESVLDWAKTILPPMTGFAGAVVGYYFGTRGGKGEATLNPK